jgi:3-mercaptopyruvate sulfurtransferase SseA
VLKNAGYKDVSALLGGLHAWETAGGEVFKAPPPPAESPSPQTKTSPAPKPAEPKK